MDLLKRGWLIFKRRWPLLVACLVIGLVGVTIYDSVIGKEYTASTTLFLRAPDVKTSASAYQGNLFTMQRSQTYVNMIQSDDLAQLVVDRLALPTTAHDLTGRVSAAPIKDTVLITISVTDGDRQQAANIANTYGTEFANYVAKVEAVSLAPDVAPLVTMIKPAAAEDASSNVWALWILLSVAGGVGLLVGILLMWLAERFDTKIRSRSQIEEVTGAKVIGNLPSARSLPDSESVDDVFESSEKFADAARAISINAEHGLREVSKVNGSSVLAVVSVKPHDGKSVAARALAKAFNERGHRVALLRVAPEGGSPESGDTPTEVIGKNAVNGQNVLHIKPVVPNGVPADQAIGSAIEELSTASDFIIVDPHGSGASAEAQVVATLSDAAVIVVRPGHTDENSLADLCGAMTILDTPIIGVITTRAKETNTAGRFYA